LFIRQVQKIFEERLQAEFPDIKKYCLLDSRSQTLLKNYVDSGKLSARGYHRVLKVARTIADMDNSENILFDHLAEALMYRPKGSIG
jgi:magnesium chelatase family protein